MLLVLFPPQEISGRAETGRRRRSGKTLCGKTRKEHSAADLYPAPTLDEIPLIPSAEWLRGVSLLGDRPKNQGAMFQKICDPRKNPAPICLL